MGAWGVKLYQDDVTEDVRDTYKNQLKRGKTNEEVTDYLIEDNEDIILDEEDSSLFWFALADTQWEFGRLLPEIKDKALECIKSGVDLEKWEEESKKKYEARKKVLADLEAKLNSPMPPEKKVSQYKIYKCQWEVGDVFAYKLEDECSIENGFAGRYVIIHKVGETVWWPGHIVPVVYIKLTKGNILPKNKLDIEECEYIGHCFGGEVIDYKIRILSTSRRIIPNKKLTFIGNFKEVLRPEDENKYHKDDIASRSREWNQFEKYVNEYYMETMKRKNN